MNEVEKFIVTLMFIIMLAWPVCAFFEYGGRDIIADRLVKFIESLIKKKRDI